VITSIKYKGCEIVIGKKNTCGLDKAWEIDFDIILGMDWLFVYRASMDCYQKKVIFRVDEIPKFTIKGIQDEHRIPIIFAISNEAIEARMSGIFSYSIKKRES